MNINNKKILSGLLALLSAGALVIGAAQAETRDNPAGYVTDSAGNIYRDSSGNCWHSGSWTPEDATVVGCDGVELDAPNIVALGEGTGVIANISMPAASMFAFDSAELNADSQAVIDDARRTVSPELSEAFLVLVVGHTDTSGDARHNQVLSLQRAESVAEYLISTGVLADNIRAIGRGSDMPIASNDTREGRIQNRRVDIFVVAEVRDLDTMLFPSAALFERRRAELTAKGLAMLEANYMEAEALFSRANYVEVVGYTEDVGDDNYNMKLSEQRARSVRDYLVSKGLNPNKVGTVGRGETRPIASNNTDEGRAQNRRVAVLLLGRVQ